MKKIHHATCPTVRIAGRGIGIGTSRTDGHRDLGVSRVRTGRRWRGYGIFSSGSIHRIHRFDSGAFGRDRDRGVRVRTSPRGYFLPRGHPSSRELSQRAVRFGAKKRSNTRGALSARMETECARVRPSVRARLASLKKAMKISSLFVFPKRRAGGRTETGASTATGRNGTERSGRRASTRGRKGTESAVVVVRRSIHPSVQAPTPTSTGDAADADADDGRWDDGRDRRRREPRGRVGADDADADDGATTGTTTGAGWQRRMKRPFLLSL